MLKKIVKGLLIVSAILLVLLVVAIVTISVLFDRYVDRAITKFNQKQSNLVVSYEPVQTSILNKSALIKIHVIPNDLKVSFESKLDFYPPFIKLTFTKVNGSGNLDSKLASLNLPPINIDGNLKVNPFTLSVNGALNTSKFDYILEDGVCAIGNSAVTFKTHDLSKIKLALNLGDSKCLSSKMYGGHSAFNLLLQDFKVDTVANLKLGSKSFSLDEVTLSFKKFEGLVSTLYAIGFSPDDNVKDKSLADKVLVDNFKLNFKLLPQGKYQDLAFKGNFNLKFAMPYIKDNVTLDYFDLSKVNYDFTFSGINVTKALKLAKQKDLDFEKLTEVFPKKLSAEVKNFSFSHDNKDASCNLTSSLLLKGQKFDLDSLKINANLKADTSLVNLYLSEQYSEALNKYLDLGMLKKVGNNYQANLKVINKQVYLGGQNLLDVASEDASREILDEDK